MAGTSQRIAYVAAGMLLLSACVVGPKYTRPSAPVPPAYKEAEAPQTGGEWEIARPRDEEARGKWWEVFGDPQLNRLEEQLNLSNQNVAASVANVQAARALIREARSQYFPVLGANPALNYTRLSTGFGQSLGINFTTYSLPLQASWEPDLFGRVRNTVKANTYAAQASAADLENVRLAAQAQLAVDYYELRGQDALKQDLDATVGAYRQALELTRDLCQAGLDNDEALTQAEAQLKASQAQDVDLGVLRAQYEHAIAVLAGQSPAAFSLRPAESFPIRPPETPAGVPSQLLERRPDIAAAERAVALANAQIGIAQAAFYPAVTLSGSAGFESVAAAKWLAWPSRIWSVGPSLAETIFDAGLRRATVQQFQAAYDQTVATYRQTVLTAFQQVEDNLAALRILAQAVEQQDSAVAAAQRSLKEAEVRYQAGLDPYLNVITAQTALLAAQQTAITFREQQMVGGVQLITALGGGWDVARLPSSKELGAKAQK